MTWSWPGANKPPASERSLNSPRQTGSKTVLLTGASGFVGRYAYAALSEAGYAVGGLGAGQAPEWYPPHAAWYCVDLRDPASVKSVPVEWSAVLHLAGDSLPSAMKSPPAALSNAAMTMNLLGHVRPDRFIFVSSCHVYAPGGAAKRETDTVAPQGIYGLSKHLAEQVSLHHPFGFETVIARPFNHVGPGMRPELMVPQLFKRLLDKDAGSGPVEMLGQNSIRDFLDVRDIVAAYVKLITTPSLDHQIYNVCSGVPLTIGAFVEAALEAMGVDRAVTFGSGNSSDDTQVLTGDATRLKATTGWQPRFKLPESIQSILDAQ